MRRLSLFILFIAGWFWFKTPGSHLPLETPSVTKAEPREVHQLDFHNRESVEKESTFTEVCRPFHEELASLNLEGLASYPPVLSSVPLESACLKSKLPSWAQLLASDYLANCQAYQPSQANLMDAVSWRQRQQPCILSAVQLRAALASIIFENADPQSLPPTTQFDLLLSAMQRGQLERALTLTEVLGDKNPSVLMARMVAQSQLAIRDAQGPSDPLWTQARVAIQKANRVADEESAKALLLVDYFQYRDPLRTLALARKIQESQPHSLEAPKFQALALYQQGQRTQASRILDRLEKKGDIEAKQIREKMAAGVENPFQIGLSTRFLVLGVP